MAVRTIVRRTSSGTRTTNIYRLGKNQTLRVTSGAGKPQRTTRRKTVGRTTFLT